MASSPSGIKICEVSSVVGVKRPAPSLLPAFELSSSPPLPRPAKRFALDSPVKHSNENQKYPTPVPTSSTGLVSSSPPPLPYSRRPDVKRSFSTLSERAPLSNVPTIELDDGGETMLMGRSSNSSHYQLSTNKLISRVHVQATYIPASPPKSDKVRIMCLGWNGAKIHCQGKVWELAKNDSFTNEQPGTDVIIDVQDTRVLVQWPKTSKKLSTPADSDSAFDSENSPRQLFTVGPRQSPFSSPLRRHTRLQSPISPSPAAQKASASSPNHLQSNFDLNVPVQVYEDNASDREGQENHPPVNDTQSTQRLTQPLGTNIGVAQSGALSDDSDLSDRDEENDPLIHAFGPFGSNLLPRMASITTGNGVQRHRNLEPLKEAPVSPQRRASPKAANESEVHPVVNHVINQLAFSRLSSTPLSTVIGNLPTALKCDSLGLGDTQRSSMEVLTKMLRTTPCIGEVSREGKDAAGRPLESEFYYIPDKDTDERRRDAVVEGLGKTGLRACRKQHKVSITPFALDIRSLS